MFHSLVPMCWRMVAGFEVLMLVLELVVGVGVEQQQEGSYCEAVESWILFLCPMVNCIQRWYRYF